MSKLKPENKFKTLRTVHLALVLGSVVFAGVLYTLAVQSGKGESEDFFALEYMVPVFGIFAFALGNFLHKKRIKQATQLKDINEKVMLYKSASLVLWALIEGTVLFGALGFYLSGRQNLILYAVMALVMLIFYRPLKARMIEELELTPEEAAHIV